MSVKKRLEKTLETFPLDSRAALERLVEAVDADLDELADATDSAVDQLRRGVVTLTEGVLALGDGVLRLEARLRAVTRSATRADPGLVAALARLRGESSESGPRE